MSNVILKRVAITVVIIVLLSIPVVYIYVQINSLASFSDAYASDWTSIFVIDHLRTSGEWPEGWEDLGDEYERLAPAGHYAWTFDELQTRVWFNWKVDMNAVRDAEPPIEVFRLTSGRRVSFNGDPNELIRDFLRTAEGAWRGVAPMGKNGG